MPQQSLNYRYLHQFFKKELSKMTTSITQKNLDLTLFSFSIAILSKIKSIPVVLLKIKRNNVNINTRLSFIFIKTLKSKLLKKNKQTIKLLKRIKINAINNKDVFMCYNKDLNVSYKGYEWFKKHIAYFFIYLFIYFLKKTAYVDINRENRNTFISIYNNFGNILKKTSTGLLSTKDPQKGRKKKLAHTAKTAVHDINYKFSNENINQYNKYSINYKKSKKFFNYRAIIQTFLNQKSMHVQQITKSSNKTFGLGCKLKGDRRKRTRRFKSKQ